MGGDWVNHRVDDIANVTDYVANGSFAILKKNVSYSSTPDFAILVRLVDFNNGWNGNYVYLPENSYRFLKKSSLDVGDVIISNVGANTGTVFRVPDLGKPATLGPNSIVIKTKGKESLRDFLYYYFSGPMGQNQIQSIITGSAQPKFNKTDFRAITIKIPSNEHEQRAIAHILGSLDDKIELNRRMNHTLEAMARAIFKSWFVDFDPVRAKAEGRPTGLPEDIDALFPDSFEDSELGEIPKGWEVVAMPEIIDVNPARKLKKGQIAPYLEMKNAPENAARALHWHYREYGSGVKFINGDVLMARITPCLENGKGAFVDFLEDDQVGWGSTEYIVFRSKKPLPLEYSYFLSRTNDFRSYTIVNMTGSSGRQRVPATIFDSYLVANPSREVSECFGMITGAIMQKMKKSDEEAHTLASLRDTLLPKLISGELRVLDAEKFVEEAGV